MRNIRPIIFTVYVVALICGTALAVWELKYTFELMSQEPWSYSFQRGGVSVLVLGLSLFNVRMLVQKGFNYFAPAIYLLSYPLIGITASVWLRSMAKGFSPYSSGEAHIQYIIGAVSILITIGIGIGGCLWSFRSPINRQETHKKA